MQSYAFNNVEKLVKVLKELTDFTPDQNENAWNEKPPNL